MESISKMKFIENLKRKKKGMQKMNHLTIMDNIVLRNDFRKKNTNTNLPKDIILVIESGGIIERDVKNR